jgi:hypothetical protein
MFSDGFYPDDPFKDDYPQRSQPELPQELPHDQGVDQGQDDAEFDYSHLPLSLLEDAMDFTMVSNNIVRKLVERGRSVKNPELVDKVTADAQDITLIAFDVLSRQPAVELDFTPLETVEDYANGEDGFVISVLGNEAAKQIYNKVFTAKMTSWPEARLLYALKSGNIKSFLPELLLINDKLSDEDIFGYYRGFTAEQFTFLLPRAFLAAMIHGVRFPHIHTEGVDKMTAEEQETAYRMYDALRTAKPDLLPKDSRMRAAAKQIIKGNKNEPLRPLEFEQIWGMVNGIVSKVLDSPEQEDQEK